MLIHKVPSSWSLRLTTASSPHQMSRLDTSHLELLSYHISRIWGTTIPCLANGTYGYISFRILKSWTRHELASTSSPRSAVEPRQSSAFSLLHFPFSMKGWGICIPVRNGRNYGAMEQWNWWAVPIISWERRTENGEGMPALNFSFRVTSTMCIVSCWVSWVAYLDVPVLSGRTKAVLRPEPLMQPNTQYFWYLFLFLFWFPSQYSIIPLFYHQVGTVPRIISSRYGTDLGPTNLRRPVILDRFRIWNHQLSIFPSFDLSIYLTALMC